MAQVISIQDRQRAEPGRCQATTSTGRQCRNRAVSDSGFCRVHLPARPDRIGPFSAETIERFLDFLLSPAGQAIFAKYGFAPPRKP